MKIEALSGIAREFRDLFFAPQCWGCGMPVEAREDSLLFDLFCEGCAGTLPLIVGKACPSCGEPGVGSSGECPRCRGGFVGFHRGLAGARYQGIVRNLIHRLKFGGARGAAYPLALLVYLGLQQRLEAGHPLDCLVPVPLHPARQRQRGYNQAELIAGFVADRLDLPLLRGVIRRTRNTPPQGKGGGGSRRENVCNAFSPVRDGWVCLLRGRVPAEAVKGLHVLLVDDVISTGATMDQCGQTLLEAGACSVIALAAAT